MTRKSFAANSHRAAPPARARAAGVLVGALLGAAVSVPFLAADRNLEHAAAASAASAAPSPRPAESPALAGVRQVLWVETAAWDAPRGTVQRYERDAAAGRFRPIGAPLPVWIGRSGLGWPSDDGAPEPPAAAPAAVPRKREGDGRSPAGVLTMGEMRGYAKAAPDGVTLPYRASDPLDRCVDDAAAAEYTRLLRAPATGAPPWRSAEELRMTTDHYKYLVVLGYNMRRPRSGAGSCIFLHVAPPPGGGTAGCTALAETDLLTLLRWLRPEARPVLVQTPAGARDAIRAAWSLPAELGEAGTIPAPAPAPKKTR